MDCDRIPAIIRIRKSVIAFSKRTSYRISEQFLNLEDKNEYKKHQGAQEKSVCNGQQRSVLLGKVGQRERMEGMSSR